jgi:hypothetical protein
MTIEAQNSSIASLAGGDSLAGDLLRGAKAIGDFLDESPKRIYYLVGRGYLKIGHLGSTLIASKQTLRAQYDGLIQGTAEPPPQLPTKTPSRHRPLRRNRPQRQRAAQPAAEAAPNS